MAYTYNDGTRIYYEVDGQGPPLLMHHWLGANLHSWRDAGYVEALKDDFRLILMDARGHGASAKAQDAAAYTLRQRVGDIVAVLDSLNVGKAHYMGYSLGGRLGFGLACLAPHRVRSLILGGAHPYAERMAFFRVGRNEGNESWAAFLENTAGGLPSLSKAGLMHNDVRALPAPGVDDGADLAGALSQVTMPVLLYAGEHDRRYEMARRAAERLPQARLLTIPGADHFQATFRTDVILPAMRGFLSEVVEARG